MPDTLKNEITLILKCPSCGSGSIHWCNISVRPYCGDCDTWGDIHHGTEQDAIKSWNDQVQKSRHPDLQIVLDEIQSAMETADKSGQPQCKRQLEFLKNSILKRLK